jgi:hypothetical protein
MRLLYLTIGMLAAGLTSAQAQDRPLYNSSGTSTATTPYSAGGAPLSLKQITQGKSQTGYSYTRGGTGYSPYGTEENGSNLTEAQINAFRERRAAEAQSAEKQALATLQQSQSNNLANANPLTTPAAVFPGQPQGTAAAPGMSQAEKPRQIYKGRDTGVRIPPKVFNSVR